MLNKQTLQQFLQSYDERAGFISRFRPYAWIVQLRAFIATLEDKSPITENQKTELENIINERQKDSMYLIGESTESAGLARKILNALDNATLVTSDSAQLDPYLLMKLIDYLRPEEIATLMQINHAYNQIFRDPAIWKAATSRHFFWHFLHNKSDPNTNWPNFFKERHAEGYKGLNKRAKQLFSSIKSGDLCTLKELGLNCEDLYLAENAGHLIFFAGLSPNHALRNYIFQNLILPFYIENNTLKLGKEDRLSLRLLHHAAGFGQTKAVIALIKAGAKAHGARNNGVTPLHIATYNGHPEVVNALLVSGTHVNARRYDRATPLYIAALFGRLEIAIALIEAKAWVNASQNDGMTPLYAAASYGHLEVVSALLAKGGDVNTASKYGETPLDIATQYEHAEVVKLLSRAKLDTVINEISKLPVSNHSATCFSRLFSRQYSRDEKLAAAVALKLATESGDMSLLNEDREILENTAELAPLYRNLRK